MRPGAPPELPGATRHRLERQHALASRADHYGLERVEVVQPRPGADWTLHAHFIRHHPAEGGTPAHGDIPPTLEPRHFLVLDDDGQPVSARAHLERLDSAHTLEVSFFLERGSVTELRHRPLTLVLTGPASVDPLFSRAPFQLLLERDEAPPPAAAPDALDTQALPPASYLAKDYESISRLMLDRMRLTVPAWQERHAADLGVMLVELLAHAGDALSYYQDAVSAEAYLGTARRRASLRRHARLLDYTVHEGCNARAWIHVELPDTCPELELPVGTPFHTAPPGAPRGAWDVPPAEHHSTFESLAPARLESRHNRFQPYTWSDGRVELPRGTTSLTLVGHHLGLRAGDVLLLEELRSPTTERPEDADLSHRHAVRLNEAPVLEQDPLTGTPLTRISWFPEDALPFSLTVGTTRDGQRLLAQVLGNLVLADHGASAEAEVVVDAEGTVRQPLGGQHMVCSERYPPEVMRRQPATETVMQQPRRALPWVRLLEHRPGREVAWTPRQDLLSSGRFERHFVADVNDGDALVLRFGDGEFGRRLPPGSRLRLRWRTGHGHLGNVGADRLIQLDGYLGRVTRVRNPLPARGGLAPEDAERVRHDAPQAFRTQERCVTDEDYVTLSRRVPGVRDAAVHLEWNGSWHVARVHVLPQEGRTPLSSLVTRVQRYLDHHRLMGIEVEVRPPELVPLDISLEVGARHGHPHGPLRQKLEQELGSGTLEDGRLAFFHPSLFGFGQPVYLAPLIARAASVPGVAWVKALRFERWGQDESSELKSGHIHLGPTEVAQVEGRPARPDLGRVHIEIVGGGR